MIGVADRHKQQFLHKQCMKVFVASSSLTQAVTGAQGSDPLILIITHKAIRKETILMFEATLPQRG